MDCGFWTESVCAFDPSLCFFLCEIHENSGFASGLYTKKVTKKVTKVGPFVDGC